MPNMWMKEVGTVCANAYYRTSFLLVKIDIKFSSENEFEMLVSRKMIDSIYFLYQKNASACSFVRKRWLVFLWLAFTLSCFCFARVALARIVRTPPVYVPLSCAFRCCFISSILFFCSVITSSPLCALFYCAF